MELFKKQKTFSAFFAPFLKFTSIFGNFERKDDPHRLCIFRIRDCKKHG